MEWSLTGRIAPADTMRVMNISGVHHPPAPAIPRPLLLLLTCLMGIASIMAAFGAMRIDRAPAYTPAADSTGHATVQRYYDAINHMLATGNPDKLRNVVSPRMLEGEPPPAGWAGRRNIFCRAWVFPRQERVASSPEC